MKTYGPYTRKDGRQIVIHFDCGKRKTESYPRYLWKLHHGSIPIGYEVDHKDDDVLNNSIENFQLLPKKTNIQKSKKTKTMIKLICVCCGKHFERALSIELNNRKTKKGPFCSKFCVGKTYH